jgi:hypothetical protein
MYAPRNDNESNNTKQKSIIFLNMVSLLNNLINATEGINIVKSQKQNYLFFLQEKKITGN